MSRWFILLLTIGLSAATNSALRANDADDLAARIDEHIATRWQAQHVEPAPTASDAEFLRRTWLDLAGRIPTAAQTRDFLDDARDNKRRRLIDELLDSGAFVGYFTRTLRAAWLPKQEGDRYPAYAARFEEFLRDRLRRDVAYDQIVRAILTAPTDTPPVREPTAGMPANTRPASLGFYEANDRKPETITGNAAKAFLGVRIECAQCHDHPFGEWKREQFWQLAAFFSDERSDTPHEPAITIPELNKLVPARILQGDTPRWTDRPPREVLAEWVTSPSNPFFAKAAVNRIWAHLFGVGLVEPIEDLTATNAPTHPELLDDLAQAFVEHQFDLKFLIRSIARSRAYGLTSRRTHPSQDDPADFARMAVKALTAEQLCDSLIRATGIPSATLLKEARDRRTVRDEFLSRFESTERRVEARTSILHALTRMNGQLTDAATDPDATLLLVALRDAPFPDTTQRIEQLFLATLSRQPTSDERTRLTEYMTQANTNRDLNTALADILWSLLNSHEFAVNH